MDTIFKVILLVLAAVFAYAAVAAERPARKWSPVTTIGVYLALFGAVAFGFLRVQSYYSPKLTDIDSFPSDTDLLIGGLVALVAVIVLALDLLGTIDLMGQLQRAISGGSGSPAGRGPGSGDSPGGVGRGPSTGAK